MRTAQTASASESPEPAPIDPEHRPVSVRSAGIELAWETRLGRIRRLSTCGRRRYGPSLGAAARIAGSVAAIMLAAAGLVLATSQLGSVEFGATADSGESASEMKLVGSAQASWTPLVEADVPPAISLSSTARLQHGAGRTHLQGEALPTAMNPTSGSPNARDDELGISESADARPTRERRRPVQPMARTGQEASGRKWTGTFFIEAQ